MLRTEKIYVSFCVLFSVLIVVANLTYQKFVTLKVVPFHTLELSVGAIIYPLTYLITGLIAEFYTKKQVLFCVRFSIFVNVLIVLIVTGLNLLPATEWSKVDNQTFHKVFGAYGVAFISSLIACYLSQLMDMRLYLWIRKITHNRGLWIRSSGSAALSLFVDTIIVNSCLMLFGILPVQQMNKLIMNSYLFKLFFTVCCIPLSYMIVLFIRHYGDFGEQSKERDMDE